MTRDKNNSQPNSDAQRCLLYLSGEMPASQVASFENQLATSPELNDLLFQQSSAISELALASEPINIHSSIPPTNAAAKNGHLVPGWAGALLTIAACFALVVGLTLYRNTTEPAGQLAKGAPIDLQDETLIQEETLIARAWASTNAEIQFLDSGFDLESETEINGVPQSSLDDSSLSWITAAVESGASIDG